MKDLGEFKNPLEVMQEGATFTIIGTRSGGPDADRVEVREVFECLAELPAAAVQMVTTPTYSVSEFVRLCLIPEHEARFDGLMRDKDFIVDTRTVRNVHNALLGHYFARPTSAPGDSGSGRENGQGSSADVSPEPAATSEPLA